MAENVQPGATGDEQQVSSSGLLLSVEPLAGTSGYKLSTDDTDAGRDSTDLTDVAGGDTDTADTSDTDSSDSLIGGDTDTTDASDADGSDTLGGDTDESDTSDADGTDLSDSEVETESGLGGVNPLGINRPERDTNTDEKDT